MHSRGGAGTRGKQGIGAGVGLHHFAELFHLFTGVKTGIERNGWGWGGNRGAGGVGPLENASGVKVNTGWDADRGFNALEAECTVKGRAEEQLGCKLELNTKVLNGWPTLNGVNRDVGAKYDAEDSWV
jgi:hypothetical protein